ncbi:acyltransferase [Plantibacter sp. Leaf314]|uniref:acyltransferase family protein n=1 Tax=Plantibacter sp. Leaf314 TaxID=1736333 RepID=UPI0012F793C8|nr:acyltransferase family protein [Plantibacter sp. Leaf314]
MAEPLVMVVVALAVGPVVSYAFPNAGSGNYWMIGLFALGMAAALVTVRGTRIPAPWFGWGALGVGILAAAWMIFVTPHTRNEQIISDTLAGTAIALALVSMGRAAVDGRVNPGRRVLEWRPLVWIGLWSYSIYLIHSPVLALANILLLPLELPTFVNWLLLVLVVLPVALSLAYGFFWLVERHFITSHQKRVINERVDPDASGKVA